MSFTVPQILEALEAQIAHLKEREAFHAAQETAHREQRARHAAELEGLARHYENLRESLGAVEGFVARKPQSPDRGDRPSLTRLVGLALANLEPDRPFTAGELAAEVDRRFGDRLKKPAERKLVAIALRRLHQQGRLRLVRKGRPHTEAIYARAS